MGKRGRIIQPQRDSVGQGRTDTRGEKIVSSVDPDKMVFLAVLVLSECAKFVRGGLPGAPLCNSCRVCSFVQCVRTNAIIRRASSNSNWDNDFHLYTGRYLFLARLVLYV